MKARRTNSRSNTERYQPRCQSQCFVFLFFLNFYFYSYHDKQKHQHTNNNQHRTGSMSRDITSSTCSMKHRCMHTLVLPPQPPSDPVDYGHKPVVWSRFHAGCPALCPEAALRHHSKQRLSATTCNNLVNRVSDISGATRSHSDVKRLVMEPFPTGFSVSGERHLPPAHKRGREEMNLFQSSSVSLWVCRDTDENLSLSLLLLL